MCRVGLHRTFFFFFASVCTKFLAGSAQFQIICGNLKNRNRGGEIISFLKGVFPIQARPPRIELNQAIHPFWFRKTGEETDQVIGEGTSPVWDITGEEST